MGPQFPEHKSSHNLALIPLFLGLALVTLSFLMLARPLLFLQILVVLLGIPVLLGGVYLVLFGLDLWRNLPRFHRNIKIDQWRFWSGKGR